MERQSSNLVYKKKFLVSASGASRAVSRLGVSSTLFSFRTLGHHDCEADISPKRILVSGFSRVESGAVRAVSIPSLEGVEVVHSTRGVGIPLGVDLLLGLVVPEIIYKRNGMYQKTGRQMTEKSHAISIILTKAFRRTLRIQRKASSKLATIA